MSSTLDFFKRCNHTFSFLDATVAQVAIAWLLVQPTVTSVVIGARTKEQLANNLASIDVHLTDEEVSVPISQATT